MPETSSVNAERVREILGRLERRGSKRNRDGMARYGITARNIFGVSVGTLQQFAKRIGRDHDLALALWDADWYETRMLSAFVDEPARVTPSQMDRWAREFENWAICDTVCLHLFDRTPHAWRKAELWSTRRAELVKRAGFALLAGLALHDKESSDERFEDGLALVENAAGDERNYVKKGVSWALRSIGQRNGPLHVAALDVARRLTGSADPAARWVGRDAMRYLTSPAVRRRVAARPARPKPGERVKGRARDPS